MILDPVVGRGRVGCDAVRWQGAPTQWADAQQEKQRSQRAVAWLNRMRSVLTRWVMAGGERNLNQHAAFVAVRSGQLPNLGFLVRGRRVSSVLVKLDSCPVLISSQVIGRLRSAAPRRRFESKPAHKKTPGPGAGRGFRDLLTTWSSSRANCSARRAAC